MYAIRSYYGPFEANEAAWMFVSEDKTEAFVFYSRVLAEPNPPHKALRLKGLNSDMDYNQLNESNVFGGDELMHAGLNIPELSGDFQSLIWRFSSTVITSYSIHYTKLYELMLDFGGLFPLTMLSVNQYLFG